MEAFNEPTDNLGIPWGGNGSQNKVNKLEVLLIRLYLISELRELVDAVLIIPRNSEGDGSITSHIAKLGLPGRFDESGF